MLRTTGFDLSGRTTPDSRVGKVPPVRFFFVEKVYRVAGWTAVVIGAVIALLRVTAIRWWEIPAQQDDPELAASIAPSLNGGDWVISWRLTRPGLGDLVQCPDPDDPSNIVIGRIAAESHDTVELDGQEVRINGEKPHIEYNCTDQTFSTVDPDTLKQADLYCDMEELGEKLHARGRGGKEKKGRHFEKRVPSGHVFLLSDNRTYPFDSRHFGTIERTRCTETIFFRLTSAEGFFDQKQRLTVIR